MDKPNELLIEIDKQIKETEKQLQKLYEARREIINRNNLNKHDTSNSKFPFIKHS